MACYVFGAAVYAFKAVFGTLNVWNVANSAVDSVRIVKRWMRGDNVSVRDVIRLTANIAVEAIGFHAISRVAAPALAKSRRLVLNPLCSPLLTTTCIVRNIIIKDKHTLYDLLMIGCLCCHNIEVLKELIAKTEEVDLMFIQISQIVGRLSFSDRNGLLMRTYNRWKQYRSSVPHELARQVEGWIDIRVESPEIPENIRVQFRRGIPEKYYQCNFWRDKEFLCAITGNPIRRIAKIAGEEGHYYEYEALKNFMIQQRRPELDIDITSDDVSRKQSEISLWILDVMNHEWVEDNFGGRAAAAPGR
jgi:hypothetical protein